MIEKLVSKLTEEEYNPFLDTLKKGTHSRKILQQLWKEKGETGRDELFRKVFGARRNATNDYLIRNELSILKKKLEDYIVNTSNTDIPVFVTYYNAYVMAQWCIKKLLIEEADKYIHEARRIAEKESAFKGLLQINKLVMHTVQYRKSDFNEKIKLMERAADDHKRYMTEYASEELNYINFVKAGAYKLSRNIRKNILPSVQETQLLVQHNTMKGQAAWFYHYKAMAYMHSGPEAILYLNKALECLDQQPELFLCEEEKIACMSTKAMEQSIGGNLTEAIKTFEEIQESIHFKKFTARKPVLFNYCTTLVKTKDYKKALYILDELEANDNEPIVAERLNSMRTNCYIFLGNLKGIKSVLPSNLQSYDVALRAYYRFLYLIYYLLKNDEEQAERELYNIKNIKQLPDTMYAPLIKIFDRYILALQGIKYNEKNTTTRIRSLKKELNDFILNGAEASTIVPGTWIIEKTQALLSIRG